MRFAFLQAMRVKHKFEKPDEKTFQQAHSLHFYGTTRGGIADMEADRDEEGEPYGEEGFPCFG